MYYVAVIIRNASLFIERSKKSVLLLGPRQTGKSTLIKSLKTDLTINLADQKQFLDHSQDVSYLRSLLERRKAKIIFIDEVQRIPEILNTVQSIVDEDERIKFYLTGSSARKVKRGGANLLPGRVVNCEIGGLSFRELDYKIRKDDLKYGFLPGIYTENDVSFKKDVLDSYVANYVNEEIKSEALVKNLSGFSRFLELISTQVADFVDYTKLAKKINISRHQVPRFFEILEDTMIGFRLTPEDELIEKFDLVKHPKFYLFDVGVYNSLQRSYEISDDRSGKICEQIVFQQIMHSASSQRKKCKVSTFRTRGGAEIDFLVTLELKKFALEVKFSDRVIEDDVRHLVKFQKQLGLTDSFLLHFGTKESKVQGIWCLPVCVGFKEMGL